MFIPFLSGFGRLKSFKCSFNTGTCAKIFSYLTFWLLLGAHFISVVSQILIPMSSTHNDTTVLSKMSQKIKVIYCRMGHLIFTSVQQSQCLFCNQGAKKSIHITVYQPILKMLHFMKCVISLKSFSHHLYDSLLTRFVVLRQK